MAIFAVLLEAMAKQGHGICSVSLNIPRIQKLAAFEQCCYLKRDKTEQLLHLTHAIVSQITCHKSQLFVEIHEMLLKHRVSPSHAKDLTC